MNYYQFHIGDYRRDTTHLSMLEHGAYRQLLDWLYLDEKPIPKETQVVMRRLSARTQEEKNAVLIVLKEFFVLKKDGSGYTHKRFLKEFQEYQAKAAASRRNGKLGGRPPKTQVVNSGLSKETQAKANQEPLTINQEPLTKNQEPLTTESKSKSKPKSKSKDMSAFATQTEPIKSKIATKIRGSTLPADWFLPTEWGQWALSEKPLWGIADVKKVFEKFKDHWLANANQAKSKKLDWYATWRNWVRNEPDRASGGRQSVAESNRAVAEQWKKDHAKIIGGTNENIGTH